MSEQEEREKAEGGGTGANEPIVLGYWLPDPMFEDGRAYRFGGRLSESDVENKTLPTGALVVPDLDCSEFEVGDPMELGPETDEEGNELGSAPDLPGEAPRTKEVSIILLEYDLSSIELNDILRELEKASQRTGYHRYPAWNTVREDLARIGVSL